MRGFGVLKRLTIFGFTVSCIPAVDPGYIGAQECGRCHAAQFAQQKASGHARALFTASEHPLAASFVRSATLLRKPNYQFRFRRSSHEIRIWAADEKDEMDIPVEWAFGAGEQAVSFVTRVNPDWYLEHYFSYYPGAQSFAPTPGQKELPAGTLPLAMGLLYKTLDPETGIVACFRCHSTGPVSIGAGNEIRPAELGVRCEACHGAGEHHRDAAALGQMPKAGSSIRNPKRMTAPEVNQFCGNCHRPPPAPGVAIDWDNAWNVRHQPVYLSQSGCFRKSAGALSCLTCHDPHEGLRKSGDAYYNGACRSCHNQAKRPPRAACVAGKSSNCTGCHMPRVSPQAYLRFTNHWIGIYAEGSKLKPLR